MRKEIDPAIVPAGGGAWPGLEGIKPSAEGEYPPHGRIRIQNVYPGAMPRSASGAV